MESVGRTLHSVSLPCVHEDLRPTSLTPWEYVSHSGPLGPSPTCDPAFPEIQCTRSYTLPVRSETWGSPWVVPPKSCPNSRVGPWSDVGS